jgi:hypothetical protein
VFWSIFSISAKTRLQPKNVIFFVEIHSYWRIQNNIQINKNRLICRNFMFWEEVFVRQIFLIELKFFIEKIKQIF